MKKAMKERTHKRDFLWWGLRVSFFGMIGLLVSFIVLWTNINPIIFFILLLFIILALIFSIINLVKKRSRKLSIAALIISIIILFLISVFFLIRF